MVKYYGGARRRTGSVNTNQLGLKMSGCPSRVGRNPVINRYIKQRVNCMQGTCGPIQIHGVDVPSNKFRNNPPYCKKKSTKCLAAAGGIGNINTPYYRTPAPGEKGCGVKGGIVHSDKNSDTNSGPKVVLPLSCDSTDGSCRIFNLAMWANIQPIQTLRTKVKMQVLNTAEYPITVGDSYNQSESDLPLGDMHLVAISKSTYLKGYIAITVTDSTAQTVQNVDPQEWVNDQPEGFQDPYPRTSALFYPEIVGSPSSGGGNTISLEELNSIFDPVTCTWTTIMSFHGYFPSATEVVERNYVMVKGLKNNNGGGLFDDISGFDLALGDVSGDGNGDDVKLLFPNDLHVSWTPSL